MISIPIDEFIKDLSLEVVYAGDQSTVVFETSDINRPGLQLADHFVSFGREAASRLQVIGNIEMTYLNTLDAETMSERIEKYFSFPISCLVICRDLDIPQAMICMAQRYNRIIFKSKQTTTSFVSRTVDYLDSKLAPHITLHGELIDVFGVGLLLMGESGIGKSETALELIERGHRLITDDVVEVKKFPDGRLVGEAPEVTRHFMEIRGIGIIDIKSIYGVGAVESDKSIDIVISLEGWNDDNSYDNLGMDEDFMNILGVNVPRITLPVRPGRNIAVIIEVAVRNFRLKNMGYNAAYELDKRISRSICEDSMKHSGPKS